MLTVFKYAIEVVDYVELSMKIGARILSFQVQGDKLCLWALVNPDEDDEVRSFRLAGTGHELGEEEHRLRYIGTAQLLDGDFVGHLFELKGVI